MLDLLLMIPIIGSTVQAIKNACATTIPTENWENRELYHKDLMSGMSDEQLMKNVENGRYKMSNIHPEPHRDPISGKVVIENSILYQKDLMTYGACKTMEWVNQGKYNLTPEELKKENERLMAKYGCLHTL